MPAISALPENDVPALPAPSELQTQFGAAAMAFGSTDMGYYSRSLAAFNKKVLLWVRQSSDEQVKNHVNSASVQLAQLDRFDVPPERIERLLALGETGRLSDGRHHFEELLNRLSSGEIGVVVIARQDRLGRNGRDHARAMEIMGLRGIMLMVDGHIFDPGHPQDKVVLDIYASFAEYENQLRTRWMRLTKLAAARRLGLRMPLPVPFVWASPDDPEYVRLLTNAGLAEFLENLPKEAVPGKAFTRSDGRRYLPLPIPDADVFAACTLMLRFLVEEDSVSDAIARTLTDQAWPEARRGCFPALNSSKFKPGRKLEIRWLPLDRDILSIWAKLPALAGTYQHYSASLAKSMRPEERDQVRIVAHNAFRGVISAADAKRVAKVVGSRIKKKRDPQRVRLHSIPRLVCAHEMADGNSCGSRLYPSQSDGVHHAYISSECSLKGHTGAIGSYIDGFALDTLAEVLSPAVLASHLDTERLKAGARARDRARLQRELIQSRALADEAAALELEARRLGEHDDFEHYREQRRINSATVRSKETALAVLGEDDEALRNVTATEVARITALGTDLPRLISHVKRHPQLARRLFRECVRAVHVSTPGKYVIRLELEFATGLRAARWIMTSPVPTTQPMRVYAHWQLGLKRAAAEIASEIAAHCAPEHGRFWSARRVHGAAIMHEHFETLRPRNARHFPLEVIAERVHEDSERVFHFALRGDFGSARVMKGEDGVASLCVAPTENELHSAFPEYARRAVSAERHWPLNDTCRLADAARRTWQPVVSVLDRVRKECGRGSVVRDLAGRSYVRLSVARVDAISNAAKAALAARPDLRALAREDWFAECDLRATDIVLLGALAPRLELPTALPNQTRAFLWVGEPVLRAAADASIRSMLAKAGEADTPLSEMHQAEHAYLHFRGRFPTLTRSRWQRHLVSAASTVRRFEALGVVEKGVRSVRYVHVPPDVYDTEDAEVFNRWLIPGYTKPPSERRARMALRAQHGAARKQIAGFPGRRTYRDLPHGPSGGEMPTE